MRIIEDEVLQESKNVDFQALRRKDMKMSFLFLEVLDVAVIVEMTPWFRSIFTEHTWAAVSGGSEPWHNQSSGEAAQCSSPIVLVPAGLSPGSVRLHGQWKGDVPLWMLLTRLSHHLAFDAQETTPKCISSG